MSKKVLTDTPGQQEVSESSIGNLSKLAGLARQAYEQKRTKDCLDLTRTILLIDPDNQDAQWLRASIQSQIHQDLENARAFLLQARSRDTSEADAVPAPAPPETQLHSGGQPQADQDLENAPASLLQAQSSDTSEADAVPTPAPPETELHPGVQSQKHQDMENAPASLLQAQSSDTSKAEAAATPILPETQPDSERDGIDSRVEQEPLKLDLTYSGSRGTNAPWRWIVGALVVLGLVSAGLLKVLVKPGRAQSLRKESVSAGSKAVAKANTPEPGALAPTAYTEDPLPVAGRQRAAAVAPAADQHPADISTGLSFSDLSPETTANQPLPPGAAGIGTLAVSSATSVDIYEGDQYLGSSPVSLELSVGMHTLEYRHGDLQRIVTQAIYANETARAMIAFDVTVPINSRPWAEVFLDGAEQKDLGQTPLSGVRVPIGSVLIFQNPKFQPKRYRVTGNETGIQIVFP